MKLKKKTKTISDRIHPVASLPLVIAALFYGKSGTGKTTIGATFPGPILHIDIREKGTDSISNLDNVDTIQLSDWGEFEELYWFLKDGKSGYNTVMIDTTSQLQDLVVNEVGNTASNKNGDLMSRRAWGIASGRLKTWLLNYRDLIEEGINVVFITHERSRELEEGEDDEITPMTGPNLIPSLASMLTASVKVVGHSFIRETRIKEEGKKSKRVMEYCMRLGPHASFITKIRQPRDAYTPDVIEDPSYKKLVSIMKGEFKPVEDKTPTKKLLRKK